MENTINIILVALSVILGFIGFFFVLNIWLVWKKVDMNVLKARVFLDPKFLISNWVYIFITGAFIVMRRIIELFKLLEIQVPKDMTIIFDLMGLVVVALLVLLAYYWYKLVDSALEHKVRKDASGHSK